MIKLSAKLASSLQDRAFGLIGKREIEPLYFETRFGIHTFGVRQAIDVVILDSTNKVVALKENLAPNRIFLWNPMYRKVLELPKGTINNTKLTYGSTISLELS